MRTALMVALVVAVTGCGDDSTGLYCDICTARTELHGTVRTPEGAPVSDYTIDIRLRRDSHPPNTNPDCALEALDPGAEALPTSGPGAFAFLLTDISIGPAHCAVLTVQPPEGSGLLATVDTARGMEWAVPPRDDPPVMEVVITLERDSP